jgi:hypothetical protein
MSFGRPMLLNAAHCLPSPVSATGARRRTSAPVQALHELNQFAAEAIASSLALNCLPERSAIGHPANTLAAPHSSHVRHSFGDGVTDADANYAYH